MNTWKVDATKILGRSEIGAVLADVKRRGKRRSSINTRQNLVIFRLATCCGLRASELCGLKISHVVTGVRRPYLNVPKAIAKGRKVAQGVGAMVVPGSGLIKKEAEAEGLDRIFIEAGFEWREPGCSMCLAMNADKLKPGERCASTSNRNFEGRQGAGGRTHLMSPTMAAAAAVTGHLTDVRRLA